MAHNEEKTSDDEAPVESLIQGRARRSTAGRHMSALLNAEADDDLALLFEEVDDDNEFAIDAAEGGDEEEDMGLDSSSDDEDDQGPNAQVDDFEGERRLEKEEKAEKKKRRAREDLRFKIASKKAKIDPTAVPATPAPRPRKKSERVSWIPTPEEGPTRSSSRRQTMQNKELTHARLKDSEEKRIRLIATMEEAARRKAKLKPKEMTQAERLAEAERVERLNSKSLNRWEEMEKRKAEERRAKIEALQNRRLEGPVLSYWSGIATWTDGRLTRVGKVDIKPKPDKEESARRKSKKGDKDGKNDTDRKTAETSAVSTQETPPTVSSENPMAPGTSATEEPKPTVPAQPEQTGIQPGQPDDARPSTTDGEKSTVHNPATDTPSAAAEVQPSAPASCGPPDSEAVGSSAKGKPGESPGNQAAGEKLQVDSTPGAADDAMSKGVPDGSTVHTTTSQPDETPAVKDERQEDTEVSPKGEERPGDAAQESVSGPSPTTQPTSEVAHPASPSPALQPNKQGNAQVPVQTVQNEQKDVEIHVDQPSATNEDSAQPTVPSRPPVIEHTGRCLTVLENFDDKTAQSREFSIYFNAKKPPRLTKISSSLCVITSLPSRYRDPETSLPFANSYAYHEIRHTTSHKYTWSPMLGCYVGPVGVAARGVPERFLDGSATEKKESSQGNSGSGSGEEPTTAGKEGGVAENTPATPAPAPPADAMDIDN